MQLFYPIGEWVSVWYVLIITIRVKHLGTVERTIPRIRVVSISPNCDGAAMGGHPVLPHRRCDVTREFRINIVGAVVTRSER